MPDVLLFMLFIWACFLAVDDLDRIRDDDVGDEW